MSVEERVKEIESRPSGIQKSISFLCREFGKVLERGIHLLQRIVGKVIQWLLQITYFCVVRQLYTFMNRHFTEITQRISEEAELVVWIIYALLIQRQLTPRSPSTS